MGLAGPRYSHSHKRQRPLASRICECSRPSANEEDRTTAVVMVKATATCAECCPPPRRSFYLLSIL